MTDPLAAELHRRMHAWIEAHHGQEACAVRAVPGDQWIERRHEPLPLYGMPEATWEAAWWRDVLERLHAELWSRALTAILGVARHITYDEAHRVVLLEVATTGVGLAGAEWGLPDLARRTPPPTCPPAGDLLLLPPPLVQMTTN